MDPITLSDSDSEHTEPKMHYYGGRVLRVSNWRKLYENVLDKLEKHTVLLFLKWFHDYLAKYLEAPKTSLPGIILLCYYLKISASYYWVDCAMVFLLWVLEYYSQSVFEERYQLPHSSAGTIIKFTVDHVSF